MNTDTKEDLKNLRKGNWLWSLLFLLVLFNNGNGQPQESPPLPEEQALLNTSVLEESGVKTIQIFKRVSISRLPLMRIGQEGKADKKRKTETYQILSDGLPAAHFAHKNANEHQPGTTTRYTYNTKQQVLSEKRETSKESYRLSHSYNKNNQINKSRSAYTHNKLPEKNFTQTESYYYDGSGRLDSIAVNNSEKPPYIAQYERLNDSCTQITYYEIISDSSNWIFQIRQIIRNDNGRIVAVDLLDGAKEKPVWTERFRYNSRQQLTRRTSYELGSTNPSFFVEYAYNEDGFLVEMKEYEPDFEGNFSNPKTETVFEYNEQQLLHRKTTSYSERLHAIWTYVYVFK